MLFSTSLQQKHAFTPIHFLFFAMNFLKYHFLFAIYMYRANKSMLFYTYMYKQKHAFLLLFQRQHNSGQFFHLFCDIFPAQSIFDRIADHLIALLEQAHDFVAVPVIFF